MNEQKNKPSLLEFASRLFCLIRDLPKPEPVLETLEFVAGALYGLRKAEQLGLPPLGQVPKDYPEFMLCQIGRLRAGEEPENSWAAGFFFNSALQRIAMSYDRIPRLVTGEESRYGVPGRMQRLNQGQYGHWKALYEKFNDYKHTTKGTSSGVYVEWDEVVCSMDELLSLLESKQPEIKRRYSAGHPTS